MTSWTCSAALLTLGAVQASGSIPLLYWEHSL